MNTKNEEDDQKKREREERARRHEGGPPRRVDHAASPEDIERAKKASDSLNLRPSLTSFSSTPPKAINKERPVSDEIMTTEEMREWFATPMSTAESIDPDAADQKMMIFDRWLEEEKRAESEAVWDKAYKQGVADALNAEELKVGIGLGGYATANRSNPYRRTA